MFLWFMFKSYWYNKERNRMIPNWGVVFIYIFGICLGYLWGKD